jgi:hypothetical protein
MTTIVTAYFQLEKSKHTHDKYLEWMQNMLIIQSPMVIFCDKDSVHLIEAIRNQDKDLDSKYPTKIIVMDFTEFYNYKYMQLFITQYNEKDHEKYHHPELYLIWNEKTHFLKTAAEWNPFHTEYFLWTDIGCFREKNTQFIHWPNTSKIPADKMLLLTIFPFTKEEYDCETLDSIPDFQYSEGNICAAIFGGTTNSILQWHEKYYQMMDSFISMDRFVGKEQNIMNSMAVLYKDMVQVIHSDPNARNIWFYLQDYLAFP